MTTVHSKPTNEQIYSVFFTKHLTELRTHVCKRCEKTIKQDDSKGYTNCVNHAKTHSTWQEEID